MLNPNPNLRVVALAQQNSHSTWWRINEPFRVLKEQGYDVEICWVNRDDKPIDNIEGAVVVLHKVMLRYNDEVEWVQLLKRWGARKVIFDLDDDIITEDYVKHMKACGRASIISQEQIELERQKHLALIQACDEVIVSTHNLAKVVRRNYKKPIWLLPNSLDIDWYTSKLQKEKEEVPYKTIGWCGGLRPNEDFEEMAKAWSYIDKKYGDRVRFVIGGYQPDILWEAVTYERIIRRPWVSIDEWPKSMQVDIGCIPLADTPFNRCKSPIKVMEFSLAGASVISNPFVIPSLSIMFRRSILAEDWVHHLEALIYTPLDKSAQEHIVSQYKEYYNLRNNIEDWVRVYES